jgi:hypothetical protein
MVLLHGDYWWAIGTLRCEGKTMVLATFPSLLCLIDGELRLQRSCQIEMLKKG